MKEIKDKLDFEHNKMIITITYDTGLTSLLPIVERLYFNLFNGLLLAIVDDI